MPLLKRLFALLSALLSVLLSALLPRRTVSLPPPFWMVLLLTAAIAVGLFVGESAISTAKHPPVPLTMDGNEALFALQGFHKPEYDARGGYRWSSAESRILFSQVGRGGHRLLTLMLGPPPPTTPPPSYTLSFGGKQAGFSPTDAISMTSSARPIVTSVPSTTFATLNTSPRPRRYTVLVPDDAIHHDTLSVILTSDTTTVPPDTRPVGLRVEGASVSFIGAPFVTPTPLMIIVQLLLLLLAAVLLHLLESRLLTVAMVLVGMSGALLWLYDTQLILLYPYLVRLAVAGGGLVLLTSLLLPPLDRLLQSLATPRLIRVLWGLTILSCTIRFAGSLYPLFAAYDLSLNVERFLNTLSGTLIATNNSIEFRNGVTVYPAGPYILMVPGILAGLSPAFVVQGGISFIDGLGAFGIAVLVRMIGGSERSSIFSALLYAATPIHLTALWWGLTAQIFAHALVVPLMIVLLLAFRRDTQDKQEQQGSHSGKRRRLWIAVVVLLSMIYLSHIGDTVLVGMWLAVAWVIFSFRGVLSRKGWWEYTIAFALSCTIGIALVYSTALDLKVAETVKVGEKIATSGYVPAYWLIYRGFLIAFHKMGFVLLTPALIVLFRRRHLPGSVELIASWLLVVGLFLGVEILTALQVRYIYFLTPLACGALALLLDRLGERGRVGAITSWGVTLLLLTQGSVYWYTGTFLGNMMSVASLLR